MIHYVTQQIRRTGLMLPWLIGAAFIALANSAWADHLPPGIQVIHVHTPAYLDRPPGSGPYSEQDIADATELAKLGDAEAQANLGIMYASRSDYQKAAYWYNQAAQAGIDTAMYNLGTLYFNGQGFPQDFATAHQWFEKAAKRGNKYAEFQLGMTYYTAQGVQKDPAQEMYWYEKAAHQGLPAAAYNLAVIYNNGEEVTPDYVKAYAWMLVAQKGGLDTSSALSAIAANLSPDQIKSAESLSHGLAVDPAPDTRQ
ncbi:MAG: tetratricopeptide repeat protein [Gammaproteobacteria bacterium]